MTAVYTLDCFSVCLRVVESSQFQSGLSSSHLTVGIVVVVVCFRPPIDDIYLEDLIDIDLRTAVLVKLKFFPFPKVKTMTGILRLLSLTEQ